MIKLSDHVTKSLTTTQLRESLSDAYDLLIQKDIRHLPVIGEEGKVVGIISDRDFQRAMKAEVEDYGSYRVSRVEFPEEYQVRHFMSWPVKAVDEDASLKDVTLRMIEEKVSAFLVTRGETLVGIVTTDDLLRVLAGLLEGSESKFKGAIDELAYNSPVGRVADLLSNAGI